jgi:acetyltransferase-like isoleucine patch superfamily enzyme
MKKLIKKILKWFYFRLRLLIRLNIFKTLYINFKTQSFKDAFKFPIFVYGRLKILSLKGNIIIEVPIKTGMIKIGYKYIDLFPASLLPTQLKIVGNLIVKGNLIVGGGVHLNVDRKLSIMEFGANCTIGGGSFIKSTYYIVCGNNVQITGECVIMDCEMHYVKDIETGIIKKNFGKILIKNNCWINQRTIITKDTVIPEYSITTRNSYLNKDYTNYGTNLLLCGSPAVAKKQKVQRIFNSIKEQEIGLFFRENENDIYFIEEEGKVVHDYNDCYIFSWKY